MRGLVWALVAVVPISLACGGGGGGDVNAPAVAPAAASNEPSIKLAFSKWKVEWIGSSIKDIIDFLPDGTYVDRAHPSDVNTWKLDGSKIHMEYNSSYVIYDGEVVDSNTLGGTYSTKGGDSGMWRAVRLE